MKKFAFNAVALAAGALAAGGALAGSISAPATATVYAVEAIAPLTAITTPDFGYTMGVGRPVGNGFTIIMTPSGSATFGPCIVPTYAGASTVSVTLKRQSSTECAYDVQVAVNPVAVNDTFNWTGQTFATHGMQTPGASLGIAINLKDPGETSQVDNAGPVSKTLGTSAASITVYAVATDNGTVVNVNATNGPLTGFVVANDDTATTARATLRFDHNSINAKNPNGATNYNFAAAGGTVSLTLSGTTAGSATNGICINLDGDGTLCEAGEVMTVSATSATSANVASGFGAQGTNTAVDVTFLADGVSQLGTSRTFSVDGTVTPTLANTVPHALVDTNAKNSTWWVWSANASQLVSPYFTFDSRFLSRFAFLNTSSLPVGWTAKCYGETGTVITASAGGTLAANGTTVVPAASVCSVTGATRAAVVFTINAPISSIKGLYQAVDPVSLGAQVVPLTRLYNAANGTE